MNSTEMRHLSAEQYQPVDAPRNAEEEAVVDGNLHLLLVRRRVLLENSLSYIRTIPDKIAAVHLLFILKCITNPWGLLDCNRWSGFYLLLSPIHPSCRCRKLNYILKYFGQGLLCFLGLCDSSDYQFYCLWVLFFLAMQVRFTICLRIIMNKFLLSFSE